MSQSKEHIAPLENYDELAIYQQALDCTDDLVWLWDIERDQLTTFGKTFTLLGFEGEKYTSSPAFWFSRIHPDEQKKTRESFIRLFKGEIKSSVQAYRILNASSKWVWLNIKARVFSQYSDQRVKSLVGTVYIVDEQKQLEGELQQSHELFHRAFEGTNDTLWDWDLETDIIQVSDSWRVSHGLATAGDIQLKKEWDPLIHVTDLETSRNHMRRLFKTGQDTLNFDYRLKLATGEYRWVMVRGQVIEYKNGNVKRIVGLLTDIHELKGKEQLLRTNQQQNAIAMSSTGSSLFHYEIEKQLLKITCFIERNGQVVPDELYGSIHQLKNAIHPADQATFLSYCKNFKDTNKRSSEAKWRTNHPSGNYQWQHLNGQVVEWDEYGKPVIAAGISQNIHDSYLIELQAIQNNQRYQLAFQDTFHSVWDWDLASDILTVNDNLTEKIFHIKAWVPTMSFWLSFIHPEDKDASIEKLRQQLLDSDEYLHDTYRIKAKTGTWVWVYFKGKVTERNKEGNATRAIGTIIDISDQKSHEFALAHEKALAEKTLQSIGDAVITTDATALITSINNKAKSLIKFDEKVALGQLLTDICNIYEEETASPIQNPFQQCIQSNISLSLSNLIFRSHDNEEFYIDCSVSPIHGNKGEPIGCVMVIRDVTRSRKMAHVIEHRAQHDSLTNLLNRHAFDKQMQELAQGRNYEHTLCYIDLDQFKIVNDTCGHIAGDELLRQLSAKLLEETSSSEVLARLGGDEFGILIRDCPPKQAMGFAGQVHKCITEHSFHWQENHFKLSASIGLASINSNTSPALAMQQADAACFMAKELGRNRTHIHELDDDQMAQAHGQMSWVPRLQKALQEDRFILFAQAITDLNHEMDAPCHFEVLIRLKDGDDVIPPGAFLPAAERYNLSTQIDKWVINKSLETLSNNAGLLRKGDVFNLNLSAQSLNEEGFLEFIKMTFKEHQIKPSLICFEITETSAIANLTAAHAFILNLKDMGCKFALDDFGTGLSSFGYLKNFPVDYIKIDGSFVKDIANDPIDEAMVKSITDIGKIMGKKTVAEWVDSQRIVDCLKEIGVDFAQGYHFSHPEYLNDILTSRSQKEDS